MHLLNKMRTSHLQYVKMVEYMEKHGDLSKPGGSRDRRFIQKKWKELTKKLNNDGTGDLRSEEKWRKVWSDFKNNCKKKYAKIKRAKGTNGRQAVQPLTDLENRVMTIIKAQAAIALIVEEAGCHPDEISENSHGQFENAESVEGLMETDWNTPATSAQAAEAHPQPPTEAHPPTPNEAYPPSPTEPYRSTTPVAAIHVRMLPTAQRRPKTDMKKLFLDSERKAREFARVRDMEYLELEKEQMRLKSEELRVREFEMQERVRQRDVELHLQAQWLDFMKEGLDVFVRYMGRKQ